MQTICELREGATTAPSLLTEADLVGLLDKNSIGTDATMAQHIETVIKRECVMPHFGGRDEVPRSKYNRHRTCGGYNLIGFEKSLSKPQLGREVGFGAVCVHVGELEG